MTRGEIIVRDRKGGKDRRMPLSLSLREALQQQRERALVLHAAGLVVGTGRVFLPHAPARKYPNADAEPGWQYPLPSARQSGDPHSGWSGRHHVSEEVL